MRLLGVDRIVEAFGDEAPLHGDLVDAVLIRRNRKGFIDRPADRAVVEDDAPSPLDPDAVRLLGGFIAEAAAEESDDDVIRPDNERIIPKADPAPRRGLTGDGDFGVLDDKGALELDGPADVKHHGPRPGGVHGLAQRSGSGVVQIDDMDYNASPTANRPGAESLGSGKSISKGWGQE